MARTRQGRQAVKGSEGPSARAILEAAETLLVEEGPAGLTMRRLAQATGASTMVLYTRFGSRDAVIDALLAEGFSRFADELGRVSEPSPREHLRELGLAYRRFALANPTHYRLMFGGGAPQAEWKQLGESAAAPHGQRAFGSLLLAVTRVLAEQDRSAREAEPVAMCVWSTVHGFVSLELCGGLPVGVSPEQLYSRALEFVLGGVVAVPPH